MTSSEHIGIAGADLPVNGGRTTVGHFSGRHRTPCRYAMSVFSVALGFDGSSQRASPRAPDLDAGVQVRTGTANGASYNHAEAVGIADRVLLLPASGGVHEPPDSV